MSKRYLVTIWRKCKAIALHYVDSLDAARTLRALYRSDDVEVFDTEGTQSIFSKKKKAVKDVKHSPKRPWASRVRCVETGQVWLSVAECQRETKIPLFTLNKACKDGRVVWGRHYEFIKDEHEEL